MPLRTPPREELARLKRQAMAQAMNLPTPPAPDRPPKPNPSQAFVPRPTSVKPPVITPPTEEQVRAWAEADAKYDVFQASLNATRPIGTKTNRPLQAYIPAQRKYFDTQGFVIRSFKRQLSLADDAVYAKAYAEALSHFKRMQASEPAEPKKEFCQKLPAIMGKRRLTDEQREISSGAKYFYTETETRVWDTWEKRQAYIDNPKNSCYVLSEADEKVYRGVLRDTLPVTVDKISDAQANIYKPLERPVLGHNTKVAYEDIKSAKCVVDADKQGPQDLVDFHPAVFGKDVRTSPDKPVLTDTVEAWNKGPQAVEKSYRQVGSECDKLRFRDEYPGTQTLRRQD